MKSIGQILHHKIFPLFILDSKGKEVYYETSYGFWDKRKYDSSGNVTYYSNSNIADTR